jgi:2-polyprenyl-3-methyl-5-hydroxy-6-metoxy-1,4-benzoquinol methylase
LTGIDANAKAIEFAQAHTPPRSDIVFETVNIFSPRFHQRKFDIVTASLFFHHFTSAELIAFFERLKDQVSIGFVINDIHRHQLAYYSIKSLTGLFSKSAMVKNDAPLSVLRAFTKAELADILRRAGIANFRIRWCWAFRWQVVAFSKT